MTDPAERAAERIRGGKLVFGKYRLPYDRPEIAAIIREEYEREEEPSDTIKQLEADARAETPITYNPVLAEMYRRYDEYVGKGRAGGNLKVPLVWENPFCGRPGCKETFTHRHAEVT